GPATSWHRTCSTSFPEATTMTRENFGSWGAELSPDDFARALAAIGAVDWWSSCWPPDLLSERLEDILESGVLPWRPRMALVLREADPRALAEACSLLAQRRGGMTIQIIDAEDDDIAWAVAQLTRPAVGAGSVTVRA